MVGCPGAEALLEASRGMAAAAVANDGEMTKVAPALGRVLNEAAVPID